MVHTRRPVVDAACGSGFTVLRFADGTIEVRGDNAYGQLGLGDTIQRLEFVRVPTPSPVVRMACSEIHTILYLEDGTVVACRL